MNNPHTYFIASLILLVMLLSGCVLHEEPHLTEDGEIGVDPTDVALTVKINLDINLPGTRENVSPAPGHIHRFIIEAIDAADRSVVRRSVLYESNLSATNFSQHISMRLHARKYNIVIWSDYISEKDILSDLFYDTTTLYPVKYKGEYTACNNAKDTFTGTAEIDLRQYSDTKGASVDVSIDLFRPVGRYQLIATDVQSFQRRLADGSMQATQFKARVRYADFIALGYNCIDGIRKELTAEIEYYTTLPDLSDYQGFELELAFDYCLCANSEIIPTAAFVEILNQANEVLARDYIIIPVQQGMNAIIRGRFLTAAIDGGMTIDSSFDGEINIDLGTLTPES